MRKRALFFSLAAMAFGVVGGLATRFANSQEAIETQAAERDFFPRGGSGTVLYVNGNSKYFNTGEAKLAICCFSGSEYAWSDAVDYRVYNDILRVMIPYKDGQAKTWSKYKICRYDPSKNPAVDGDGGVYNQTDDLSFSAMQYYQNTVNLAADYGEGSKLVVSGYSPSKYYGIEAETHMYLDLKDMTGWENENAKFAIWFAYPNSTNESRWSVSNSSDGYRPSFCWKVNGQDNDHLYECIVPNIYASGTNIWNMAIAVRFNPEATEPNWDYAWNQTQNLSFNGGNHTANMIHVEAWNKGEFDAEHSISKETRLEFYGNYFLDTVACSGTGATDATTAGMWNAVKAEYENHLSTTFQGDIWLLDPEGKDTQIAKAMARYDYILFKKQYAHADFINRAESEGKTNYANLVGNQLTVTTPTLVIMLSLLASGAVVGLLLYRNAKRKRQ